ncbi:hypothetical protein AS189_04130 [Arthrobacter alpinus]|uniref:Uncharacterized protein n=1 Tax=Arthrobacter alpinus TaxID=656366 RepID=A0A0S2LWJ5_9MICC|nr:glycoside hydrolase N-terminal domain-containing protein [Arthrobacter alpinus]ALO65829.1 hypothetical protein AS189_04130 [Arthrobacter alpinus]
MSHRLDRSPHPLTTAKVTAQQLLTELPAASQTTDAHTLCFDAPAQEFTQALPLGNGRLGAMCYGGVGGGRITLNDSTAWSGGPGSEAANTRGLKDGPATIARAREAVSAGLFTAAETELAKVATAHTQSYLPFAELLLELDFGSAAQTADGAEPGVAASAQHYRRTLDLHSALHEHSYTVAGRSITEQVYVSPAHQVMVVELRVTGEPLPKVTAALASQLRIKAATSHPGAATLELQLPTNAAPDYANPPTGVEYDQPGRESLRGAVVAHWIHDGTELSGAEDQYDAGTLAAAGVSRLRLVLATATNFVGSHLPLDPQVGAPLKHATELVQAASKLTSTELFQSHTANHQELYERAELDLGSPAGDPEQPTDVRIRETPADPALAALLFNYGRYLLISSSRPGTLASTLQGIWNESMQPPWSSNFTININTQMNYWAAEASNLAECHEPLFDLLESLSQTGRHTARTVYGLEGWVAHHNTDAWAFTSPVAGDASWGFWPMGGAWLATHLIEHVRHGGSEQFAAERAWPIIKGASEFALGWLIPQADGTLGTSPSTSPENHFQTEDGTIAAAGQSSTADLTIIARLFRAALELAPAGDPLTHQLETALGRLPQIPVAPDGTISEWAQPYDQPEPTHRHVSHLYFAYPGETELTPDLAQAVARTLDARGDDSTGWSLAWKLALRARLKDTVAVERLLALVFRTAGEQHSPHAGGLYPNMFAAHPPFQIDGNFGFVAGVVECLVQSHTGHIELLPAVPSLWPQGSVRGLVVRPGIVLDLSWGSETGTPTLLSARLRAKSKTTAGPASVTWGELSAAVHVSDEAWTELTPADFSS